MSKLFAIGCDKCNGLGGRRRDILSVHLLRARLSGKRRDASGIMADVAINARQNGRRGDVQTWRRAACLDREAHQCTQILTGELKCVRKALYGIVGERLQQHAFNGGRDGIVEAAGSRKQRQLLLLQQELAPGRIKGTATAEPFIGHNRQGILVAIEGRLPLQGFRRFIREREILVVQDKINAGQSEREVGQEKSTVRGGEQIAGVQVIVHHVVDVRVVDGVRDGREVLFYFVGRNALAGGNTLAERLALYIIHHQIGVVAGEVRVDNVHNITVLELLYLFCAGQKGFFRLRRGERNIQLLQQKVFLALPAPIVG